MDVERDLWRVNALSTGCKTRLASPVTLYVQVGGWSKGSFTCGQARLNLHPLICLGRCLFIFQHCNRFLRSGHEGRGSTPGELTTSSRPRSSAPLRLQLLKPNAADPEGCKEAFGQDGACPLRSFRASRPALKMKRVLRAPRSGALR